MEQDRPKDSPAVPGEFGVDTDPFTDEDGRGDDVDKPLPEIDITKFQED